MGKTQKNWVSYFNERKLKMISASDIYHNKNKDVDASLQKDFNANWEVTSTRIIYNKDNLMAEIIHDVGSIVVKPKSITIKVPIFNGNFEQNAETEKYLQALFGTEDNLPTILTRLRELGNNKTINLWTPSQSSRQSTPERAVRLCYGYQDFHVDGYSWIDGDGGISRGVLSGESPAKQGKRKVSQ
jgi:hypothetical protein